MIFCFSQLAPDYKTMYTQGRCSVAPSTQHDEFVFRNLPEDLDIWQRTDRAECTAHAWCRNTNSFHRRDGGSAWDGSCRLVICTGRAAARLLHLEKDKFPECNVAEMGQQSWLLRVIFGCLKNSVSTIPFANTLEVKKKHVIYPLY